MKDSVKATKQTLDRRETWGDIEIYSSRLHEKRVCKIIKQSVLTLARRCLFIAPTPPGPLRILKTQISGQNEKRRSRRNVFTIRHIQR